MHEMCNNLWLTYGYRNMTAFDLIARTFTVSLIRFSISLIVGNEILGCYSNVISEMKFWKKKKMIDNNSFFSNLFLSFYLFLDKHLRNYG